MGIVEAKCTSCGANLKVDDSQEAAVCEACNSAYIVEKAIHYYNQTYNYNSNTVNNISNSVVMMSKTDEEEIVNKLKDARYYEHYDRKKAMHIYYELRNQFPREPRISVQQIQFELKRIMKLKSSQYFSQPIFDIMVQHKKIYGHFYGDKAYKLYDFPRALNGVYGLCLKSGIHYSEAEISYWQWLYKLGDAIDYMMDFKTDEILKLWSVQMCTDNLNKIIQVEGDSMAPEIKDMVESTLRDCKELNIYKTRIGDYVSKEIAGELRRIQKPVNDLIYLMEAQNKREKLLHYLNILNLGMFSVEDYNTIYFSVLKQKERYRKSAREIGVYINPEIHQIKQEIEAGFPNKHVKRSRKLYTLDHTLINKHHQDAHRLYQEIGQALQITMPKLERKLSTV